MPLQTTSLEILKLIPFQTPHGHPQHRGKTVLFLLDSQSDREPSSVKDTAEQLTIFKERADLGDSMLQGPEPSVMFSEWGERKPEHKTLGLNLQLSRELATATFTCKCNFKLYSRMEGSQQRPAQGTSKGRNAISLLKESYTS